MIESIGIHNYGVFQNIEFFTLDSSGENTNKKLQPNVAEPSNVTAIVGSQNSGKSSLIKAIKYVKAAVLGEMDIKTALKQLHEPNKNQEESLDSNSSSFYITINLNGERYRYEMGARSIKRDEEGQEEVVLAFEDLANITEKEEGEIIFFRVPGIEIRLNLKEEVDLSALLTSPDSFILNLAADQGSAICQQIRAEIEKIFVIDVNTENAYLNLVASSLIGKEAMQDLEVFLSRFGLYYIIITFA